MPEGSGKSQRILLKIGAGLVIMAAVPLAQIADDSATPAERLKSLRAAAQAGSLALLSQGEDGHLIPFRTDVSDKDDGFDRSVAFEKAFDKGRV